MLVLGIETSCDDTAVAVVRDGHEVLSNLISSQDDFHRAFSGVVPEIASRRHLEVIHLLIEKALSDAGVRPEALDRVAVSNRPGLVGSLLVGVAAAKAFALAWRKPLVAINHLAAHLYAASFSESLAYPHLGLIISGGHTLLVEALSPLDLTIFGSTIDDAVGEVYDKIAKYLGLGYPGGPLIDRLAIEGDPAAWTFPRTLLDPHKQRYHFSFSGLKTAVIHQRDQFVRDQGLDQAGLIPQGARLKDLAASFQATIADILIEKSKRLASDLGLSELAVTGGVAANSYLRARFSKEKGLRAVFPPRGLCTDNAVMVAGTAYHADQVLSGDDLLGLEVFSRVIAKGPRRQGELGGRLR